MSKRGKVAGTRKTSEVITWPNVTAAQFERMPGHEKTALYFATSASVRWQAKWHNDFREALEWFSIQLSIQDRKRLWAARA